MTCNIDAKGKRVRLLMGVGLDVVGVLVAVFWARWGGGWRWGCGGIVGCEIEIQDGFDGVEQAAAVAEDIARELIA